MKWHVTDEARRFLTEKGRPLTVQEPVTARGCCITVTEAPGVRYGEPAEPDTFRLLHYEDVRIYVPRVLDSLECDLTITVRSLFGFRTLVVEGWRLA
jgi:hypothetical protein